MTTSLTANTSVPPPSQAQINRGYGASSARANTGIHSGVTASAPAHPAGSPFSQSAASQQNYGRFHEEWDASQRGSSIIDVSMQRSDSVISQGDTLTPSRGGTLKKKASMRRTGSMKRSSSRRSSRAGSVRSLALQSAGEANESRSAFYSPVPTTGNPTEVLANRFQAWRKVLKDLIAYYREIQSSYDHRSKSLLKISNVINNTSAPAVFLESGGIDDAAQILRSYHKSAISEANKSKEIEEDVIMALTGLRSDLNQKIKEIKSLSSDFKNSVEKEMDGTRRAVNELQEALGQSDIDPAQMTGKKDPYLLKLAADRQVEKQIDEENYLHQAYLNLEASGRELEAIVVGEIQKSHNAYAGILKREADAAYDTADELRTGPIAMPKDHEWNYFVQNDDHFVNPNIPVRQAQNIQYPGRDNELAQEVRAGLLERKSKYLKSYTAGWYVLTPTHLHEFKSADKAQAPIMSLYLPEQKLGSHSNEGSSSNKFMLKGRQTGSLHRGHSWVFRAESYDTMNAWYEDIRTLTEKSPQERSAFVRQHARSVSGTSQRAASISSDGIMDEEDEEPFAVSNTAVISTAPKQDELSRRPQPGGRFPSDISLSRGLQAPLSPSSGSSGFEDRYVGAPATDILSSNMPQYGQDAASPTHAAYVNQKAKEDGINPYTSQRISQDQVRGGVPAPVGGVTAIGAVGTQAYHHYEGQDAEKFRSQQEEQAAREATTIAAPDTYEHELEAQAASEAATYAAPDTAPIIAASDSKLVAGDCNEGDVTANGSVSAGDAYPEDPQSSQTNPIENALRPLTEDTTRPSLAAGQNHQSVQSVSQLHVPGEFPKDNAKAPLSLA
ncbi:ph domain-containing protein, partial [Diplocarpon rosae]